MTDRRMCDWLLALAVALFGGQKAVPGVAAAADPAPAVPSLNQDQVKLLTTIDADTAKEIVEIAAEAQKWKDRLEAIRKRAGDNAKAAKGAIGDELQQVQDAQQKVKNLQNETPTELLLEIARFLAKRSPNVAKQVQFLEQLQAKFKEAEEKAKNAKYDAKVYFDLEEAEFRREVRDLAMAAASHALLKAIDKDLFAVLEQHRHPAQFARSFVEAELKKNYLNKPYPVGDVTFKVVEQNITRPVFSPDANLTLVVDYKAGGIELKASGLYFRYVPGKLPEPVFDRVKVEPAGLDALAGKAIKGLGGELPDAGLPIKVVKPTVTGFDAKDAGRAGSVSFGVVIGLDDTLGFGSADLAKVTADVVITTTGKVTVTGVGGAIKGQLPVGTTGLILDGGTIGYEGTKKRVTVDTFVCPAAGGREGISLDVSLTFGFPVTKTGIAYKGSLVLGRREVLGTIDGVITKEKITGTFETAAGMPVRFKKCKFELNREAFSGSGAIEALYGVGSIGADIYEGFDGNGRFTVSERFEIARAVKAEASLTGTHSPGFKKLRLEGVMAVDVDAPPLGTFGAVVHLVATNDPKPVIHGTGTVGDVSVAFSTDHFGGVYDALKRALMKERDALYRYMADREKAARAYAAEREKAFDTWVFRNASKLGVDALRTGNPTLDRMLGQKSEQLKAAGKQMAHWREDLGAGAAHATQQAGKEADKLATAVTNFASNPGSALSHGLGLRGPADGPAGKGAVKPAPVRAGKVGGAHAGFELAGLDVDHAVRDHVKQVDRAVQDAAARARLTARLTALLDGIEKEHIHKSKHGRNGDASELRVRFARAMAHPDGASDAVVTVSVQVNSFRHTLDVHKPAAKPVSASDLGVAELRMKGVHAVGRPKVEVHLPKMKNVSEWDADALTRDHLTQLCHKLLGGDAGSRFDQRLLALHNATDEPIKAWVQFEHRATEVGGWAWLPDGRGPDRRAFSFTVPPHRTNALRTPGGPVAGRSARIWAESEGGRVWVRNLHRDVPLVGDEDETGALRYHADSMEYYVYALSAPDQARTIRERVVAVKNATAEPVTVHAAALTRDPSGKEVWDETKAGGVVVEPGATVVLRQGSGWLLRGTEAKVWAEANQGKQAHWTHHKTQPVRQVGPQGYTAKAIGSFLYVLEPPGRQGGAPGPDATEVHIPADQAAAPRPNPPMPKPPAPAPAAAVAVPGVNGLGLDAARKKVEGAGLRFAVAVGRDVIPPDKYEQYRTGWHVARQSHPPSGRADTQKGATVTCTLERDPPKPPK